MMGPLAVSGCSLYMLARPVGVSKKTDMKRWPPLCQSVPTSQVIVAVPARTVSARACAPVQVGPFWLPGAARGASSCRREFSVLNAAHRLRSSAEFAQTIRQGVRVGRPTLVVHAWRRGDGLPISGVTKVGFVVSRAVGTAVTRNRVKRRLRAISTTLVSQNDRAGVNVVVRALPVAADETKPLANDLQQAWRKALKMVGEP